MKYIPRQETYIRQKGENILFAGQCSIPNTEMWVILRFLQFFRADIVKTHKVIIILGYIISPGLLKQEHDPQSSQYLRVIAS